MEKNGPMPLVRIGHRVYKHRDWTRSDLVLMGEKKIGIIKLNNRDRMGKTISLITQQVKPGRQVDWCVAQSQGCLPLAKAAQKGPNEQRNPDARRAA
jgi:hypothetical protein